MVVHSSLQRTSALSATGAVQEIGMDQVQAWLVYYTTILCSNIWRTCHVAIPCTAGRFLTALRAAYVTSANISSANRPCACRAHSRFWCQGELLQPPDNSSHNAPCSSHKEKTTYGAIPRCFFHQNAPLTAASSHRITALAPHALHQTAPEAPWCWNQKKQPGTCSFLCLCIARSAGRSWRNTRCSARRIARKRQRTQQAMVAHRMGASPSLPLP